MNAECSACGVTAADMPWEELDIPTVEDAGELPFVRVDGVTYCRGCAP